jgi:hypothetical protein
MQQKNLVWQRLLLYLPRSHAPGAPAFSFWRDDGARLALSFCKLLKTYGLPFTYQTQTEHEQSPSSLEARPFASCAWR